MRVLTEEGIAGFYHGFGATMLNTFFYQYAYFSFYSLPARLSPITGALAQVFTIPLAVNATRQKIGAPKGEAHDGSFFSVAREIVREEGVTGLWLGLIKNTSAPE